MIKNKISSVSIAALCIAAILLLISIFVPIWQIELNAPQYPEGLALQIWANKIAGDVEIINGLNHYIGMKTLHTADFIEFKLLPYIISAYALLFIIAAVRRSRGWLNFSFIAFVVFGIVAMADFWKWEYDYGHNLDPNAAIRVPGMAYQPPLIGFKQLLNFGAYSIPSTGGWLFVISGLLLLLAVAKENGWLKKRWAAPKMKTLFVMCTTALLLASCESDGPQPIRLNTDNCSYCRMTISDHKWAAEVITDKGRVYKFDDLSCMLRYASDQQDLQIKRFYISNHAGNNELIDAKGAWYVHHTDFKSPMGGNTAAFTSKEVAEAAGSKLNAPVQGWSELNISQPPQKTPTNHGQQH